METKTIKISKENYVWLLNLAIELQKVKERPVSFDEAIFSLKKIKNQNISELAGTWISSEAEANKIKKDIKNGWGKWKIPSV